MLRDEYDVLTDAVEYIEPVVADGYEATCLAARLPTTLFQLERITRATNGAVAEYRRALLRGDLYRYRIELR